MLNVVVHKFLDCGNLDRGFARVLAPVPHRHYVLAIPKMLRPYFQRHRSLLKCLCVLAHQSLTEYLGTARGLPTAHPALILTLHTFGEYLDFHPHLHALAADGLFTRCLNSRSSPSKNSSAPTSSNSSSP